MIRDQSHLTGALLSLRARLLEGGAPEGSLQKECLRIQGLLDRSLAERRRREAERPRVTFPRELPIAEKVGELVQAIQEHPVIVVSGETGCGKSTQLPKMCILAGRGIGGKIGCTQPRRIAATTLAHRISEEMGEPVGASVGYKIRFSEVTSSKGYVQMMTDGILLAEAQVDPSLSAYDTLIIDEAHERSLNIDFLLGILRTLLPGRQDLKLIISSATLDTEKFAEAFGGAPVLKVSGRLYPVTVAYRPMDAGGQDRDLTYVDWASRAVEEVLEDGSPGDVLVFMPTEQDILETCDLLRAKMDPRWSVLPLFARLTKFEQLRVYSVQGPKIVVATNVAETSLTIPGIRYVVDTGLARISQYLPRTRTTALPIVPVSRSSADQRAGRCGRVSDGVCIRLYSREDYEARPLFTPPEILRSNLAEVILRMLSLNLGDVQAFPFLDRPAPKAVQDGFDLLGQLGALRKDASGHPVLTARGRVMAGIPLDPRITRILIEAGKEGCLEEAAVLAAALSIQDPRERPLEKAEEADRAHAPFRDRHSDFLTLLAIWRAARAAAQGQGTKNALRRFCREHFLSFPRMREWGLLYDQIMAMSGPLEQAPEGDAPTSSNVSPGAFYGRLHRAILSGFLSNIALRKERNLYRIAKGQEAMLFPGSGLFNRGPEWIVAAERVMTTRLYARTVARIDPEWLEKLGVDLCRRSYEDPHWEKDRGEVRAYENVTLFGLPIVMRRPVSYGPIDPEEAHRIFVACALVQGEVKEPLPFLLHNQALWERLLTLEEKLRRRGILKDPEARFAFYADRLQGICDLASLKRLLRKRGDDTFLRFTEKDLLASPPEKGLIEAFPDEVRIGRVRVSCSYRFTPGKEEDGVTLQVPLSLAPYIPAPALEWGIEGLFMEKITACVKGLPKAYRKLLVPVSQTVEIIVRELPRTEASLAAALSRFVHQRFGVDIPASVWASVELPAYLTPRVALINPEGGVLRAARGPELLKETVPSAPDLLYPSLWKKVRDQWEVSAAKAWDFGALPERIALTSDLFAFPGLVAGEGSVDVRLFSTSAEAAASHRRGVLALYGIVFPREFKMVREALRLPKGKEGHALPFGGKESLEREIRETFLERLFCVDIRTREDFLGRMAHFGPALTTQTKSFLDLTLWTLEARWGVSVLLTTLEKGPTWSPALAAFCTRIRGDMDALVPRDFLKIYALQRLEHLPRYLKALQIRAERGAIDLEKDRKKAAQLLTFVEALAEIALQTGPPPSEEKCRAIEDYRWSIEEFKVSLFAPELKTAFPISAKRLRSLLSEIHRLV